EGSGAELRRPGSGAEVAGREAASASASTASRSTAASSASSGASATASTSAGRAAAAASSSASATSACDGHRLAAERRRLKLLLEKGVTVSGYRIDGVLGVGGMGVVYEATQLSLERTVALKLISSELGSDDGFRERFRREGQIQAAIDHPHIVPVYEAGESDYGLFIAMRLIRGRNLKDL